MKHGKRPTKKQKLIMSGKGLNPDDWLFTKYFAGELHLEHRHTGQAKVIRFVKL